MPPVLGSHFLFGVILLCFCAVQFVSADYNIDDSNYSILKFSNNPSGPVWGPFGSDTGEELSIKLPNGTMLDVQASWAYNNTYTYAACETTDNCQVEFPFTGSGVTIYVLQAGPQGMSANITIDGGSPMTNTLAAPPAPNWYISNVKLFDVQSLPSGDHTLTMTVLTWDGIWSGMMLDYVTVNQTLVNPPATSSSSSATTSTSTSTSSQPTTSSSPTTSSPLPSSTSISASGPDIGSVDINTTSTTSNLAAHSASGSPVSSSGSHVNVAVVAGSAAGGGVAAIAAVGALLYFCRRRRSQAYHSSETLLEPKLAPASRGPAGYPATIANTDFPSPVLSAAPLSAERPDVIYQDSTHYDHANLTPSLRSASMSDASRSHYSVLSGPNLTDGEVDFVHGLYNSNVPAPVVARVLERMVANRDASGSYEAGDSAPVVKERAYSRPPTYRASTDSSQMVIMREG
ncbi:hypothetical protein BV22DRAFT_1050334 [Leucogyrophana mollusca]|uniref:Uncharacterized protein n=1 Tax=Leucogyrophana mollusca TaxID=85980 RepID=A0ACB8B5U0_9AGAM|nr:hypothetical protein BV22DRAFT_1050334 [Leucogyrophana mollusca]